MQLSEGQEVDGYRIESVLGRGGMGVVYKAEDVALSREVALKVINPSMSRDEQFVRRFQTEARTLAKVNSPNIVGIHAFRQTEHGLFIVMEYVEGGDLADMMAGNPLPVEKTVSIMKQLLRALQHAHGAGVIHRDIKPANVMISKSGTVKVTDFGLAKMSQADMTRTMSQGAMGTLYYMSPEQIRGDAVDFRVDLWSLGCVFYELLTGAKPFEAAYEASVMYSIINEPVSFPPSIQAALPRGLIRIVEKMLEKNRDDRYPDASAILAAVESLDIDGADTGAVRAIPPPAKPVARKKGKGLMIAGAALVVMAVAAAGYVFLGSEAPDDQSVGIENAADQPVFTLFTTPDTADVFLDNRFVGISPIDSLVLESNIDSVSVRIEKEGFETIDRLFSVTSPHHVYLNPVVKRPAIASGGNGAGSTQNDRAQASSDSGVSDRTGGDDRSGNTDRAGNDTTPAMATASVVIHGRGAVQIGNSTLMSNGSRAVPSGNQTVRCISSSGAATARSISFSAGKPRNVTCYFTAKVTVVAEPVWGYVYVNGERTEFTTPHEFELDVGSYDITVEKKGYGADLVEGSPEKIDIKPGYGEQPTYRYAFRLTKQ